MSPNFSQGYKCLLLTKSVWVKRTSREQKTQWRYVDTIHELSCVSYVGRVNCESNDLQNDLFSSKVISCLTQCRERCMVAKGPDRTEVLPPETEVEQSRLDAPRMETLMEWPSVAADSRTLLCLNLDWYLVLDSHINLKVQVEGSHCSWELQKLQQSTSKQM